MSKQVRYSVTTLANALVDAEAGVIRDVAIMTVGEARGHGERVDLATLQALFKLSQGRNIKAYINHLNDPSPTDAVGFFSGFYIDTNRNVLKARYFNAFKSWKTDDPKSFNRLFEMASTSPDALGVSVVIDRELQYSSDGGMPFIRPTSFDSADFVSSPAANKSLFKARKFEKWVTTKDGNKIKIDSSGNILGGDAGAVAAAGGGHSTTSELSVVDAEKLYEDRVVPEGWTVHGRGTGNSLNTGNVIQSTDDWNVADQYAGKEGSLWLVKPSKDANIVDISSETQRRDLASSLIEDWRARNLDPDLDEFIKATANSAGLETDANELVDDSSMEDFISSVSDQLNPKNIVDTAQIYDVRAFANWATEKGYDGFSGDSERGRWNVAINPEAYDQVKLPKIKKMSSKKKVDTTNTTSQAVSTDQLHVSTAQLQPAQISRPSMKAVFAKFASNPAALAKAVKYMAENEAATEDQAIQAAEVEIAAEDLAAMKAENEKLKADNAALVAKIAELEGSVAEMSAPAGEAPALKEELGKTKAELSEVKGQLSAATARLARYGVQPLKLTAKAKDGDKAPVQPLTRSQFCALSVAEQNKHIRAGGQVTE